MSRSYRFLGGNELGTLHTRSFIAPQTLNITLGITRLPNILAASDSSLELAGTRECVVSVMPLVRTKTGPVRDCLTLVQVAAALDHRDQIATVRVCFEHLFECLIKYSRVHAVCDVAT